MFWNKIKLNLKLARIHSSVLTGLAPVCTAAAIGVSLSISHYIQLFIVGLLFHIFLFVLNELKDIEIDKTSLELSKKPLVEGTISLKNAKIFVIFSIILIFISSFVFFRNQAFILTVISIVALVSGGLYDYFGKRLPHADYMIAFMLFFVALYGGFSITNSINFFVLIITLLAFFQMLINNITAGLKDIDHDYLKGGLSTPLRLKVHVKNNKFYIPFVFIFYIIILKSLHILFTVLPFYLNLITTKTWQLFLIGILILMSLMFLFRLLRMKIFNREKIKRAIGFHEMFAFMIVPILLFEYIGLEAAIFLSVLPVIWLGVWLKIIYGKFMPEI